MHWTRKYLSVEYNKMNCSKFAEYVLRDHFKIDYSFPQSEGSIFNQSKQIKENIPLFCEPATDPKDGDLVLMHGIRMMCHVGLYVKLRHLPHVIHCESSIKTSALHRFSDLPMYGFTVAGVYTWRK